MGSEDRAVTLLERLVAQVAEGIASESGPGWFDSLVRNLAKALPADYVFAGSLTPDHRRIVELAAFGAGAGQPHEEFDRDGTPFQAVAPRQPGSFAYADAALELFPNDPILRKVFGKGYVGVPLVDSRGCLTGAIGVVTRRAMEDTQTVEELVRAFSTAAARELERTTKPEPLERQPAETRRASVEAGAGKSALNGESLYLRDAIPGAQPAEIGNSPEFRTLMNHARRLAGASGTVLILGETGSGKELAARAIHNMSARRNRPLVKLDCAATPPELLELALFGGLRDARSGVAPLAGRLEEADEGTLLLDEVAELPLEAQGKLLRVMQQGEFRPLGSPRSRKIDVRLLVTTNRDLEQAVKEERFRPDLYQRLVVDPVQVPPLRRRRQDIPLLAEHFLKALERRLGRTGSRISSRMMTQMMSYHWPGNIRELECVLYQAALSGPAELDMPLQPPPATWPEPVTLHDAERHHVARTLDACNWVIEGPRGAAAALKVPPSTLRSLMKRLQIRRADKNAAS